MAVSNAQYIDLDGRKITVKQTKELVKVLEEENELFRTSAVCPVCGRHLPDRLFYKNADPDFKSGKIIVCIDCLKKVFYRVGEDDVEHKPTKESLIAGLKLANKPFSEKYYQKALTQASSSSVFDLAVCYMRVLQTEKDTGTFGDSDFFILNRGAPIDEKEAILSSNTEDKSNLEQLQSDREDVIRLTGYDPFANESFVDQPFLYSQLLGILDSSDDSSDDQMKIQSAVSIVRSFLQVSKIDDSLSKFMSDPTLIQRHSSEINKLQDTKTKIQSGITKLAAESCISLKNSKGNTKGDNTWTGKIKKCKDLALRASENNGYDLKTCKGMLQCAEISSQAILKALKLDESDYSDMLAEQRERLTKLENQVLKAEETARILLRENLDLKDLIHENGINIYHDLVNLDDLLTSFEKEEEERISFQKEEGDDG